MKMRYVFPFLLANIPTALYIINSVCLFTRILRSRRSKELGLKHILIYNAQSDSKPHFMSANCT